MSREKAVVFKWTTFIAVITAIVGAVVAHFEGIAAAKAYTDLRLKETEETVYHRMERMEDKLDTILKAVK